MVSLPSSILQEYMNHAQSPWSFLFALGMEQNIIFRLDILQAQEVLSILSIGGYAMDFRDYTIGKTSLAFCKMP